MVRGPDWCWGDQDRQHARRDMRTGPDRPFVGTIVQGLDERKDGKVTVKWGGPGNEYCNEYRMGANGCYDLALAGDKVDKGEDSLQNWQSTLIC